MSEAEEGRPDKVYGQEVVVDGTHQAYEMERIPLRALSPTGEEVYLRTKSGNIYAIYVPKRHEGEVDFAIMGLRGNEGKSKEAKGTYLTRQNMESGVLELGRPFRYGQIGSTTEISGITYLTGKTGSYKSNPLHSNIRSEFWGKINGGR